MSTQTEIKKVKGFRGLTFTLAVAFLTLGVVVIIVSCSMYVYFNIQTQQQVITTQQNLIAKDAANTVRSFIQEKFSVMEATAGLSNLIAVSKDEQKNILDKLMGRDSSFRQLILLDGQNQTVVQTSRLSQSASNIDRRLDNDFFAGARNGRYASTVYIDMVTDEPMMIMAVPIRNIFGDFQGILAAEVNLKFMWDMIDNIKVGRTGLVYVVDKRGDLIAFADISRVLKRENLAHLDEVAEFVNGDEMTHTDDIEISMGIEGTYAVVGHEHLIMPDWAVIIELPVNEAYESVFQQMWFISLTILLTIGLTAFFGFYLSRRIVKPIITLRDAAVRIGQGKLDTRIDVRSKDEIGELASTFDQMMKDLKKSRTKVEGYSRNLEKQVQERTSDLNEKVKEVTETKTAIMNMMEDAEDTNRQLMKTQGELKVTLDEMKKIDVKKDEFISITAHEFKTPLTAIKGFADLLQGEKLDSASRKKYLGIIKDEAKRLAKLVTEILEFSRIDLGTFKLNFESVDLPALIDGVKAEIDVVAKEKGLKTAYNMGPGLPKTITTDFDRLKQVLLNIMNNALKYTPKGSIELSVENDKEGVRFNIKDTGIGIPKSEYNKLFQRFYQIDSSYTRGTGGSGIGLALSKELLEKMGGRIWFESEQGKGSTFHFTVPVKPINSPQENNKKERHENS